MKLIWSTERYGKGKIVKTEASMGGLYTYTYVYVWGVRLEYWCIYIKYDKGLETWSEEDNEVGNGEKEDENGNNNNNHICN